MNIKPAPETDLISLVCSFGGSKGPLEKMFTSLKREAFSHHVRKDHNLDRDWDITWEDVISIFAEEFSKDEQ